MKALADMTLAELRAELMWARRQLADAEYQDNHRAYTEQSAAAQARIAAAEKEIARRAAHHEASYGR